MATGPSFPRTSGFTARYNKLQSSSFTFRLESTGPRNVTLGSTNSFHDLFVCTMCWFGSFSLSLVINSVFLGPQPQYCLFFFILTNIKQHQGENMFLWKPIKNSLHPEGNSFLVTYQLASVNVFHSSGIVLSLQRNC